MMPRVAVDAVATPTEQGARGACHEAHRGRTCLPMSILDSLTRGRSDDWADVPAAIGGTIDASGVLSATIEGIEVRGQHTYELVRRPNHDDYYRYYTHLYAIIDPPLRMGLRLSTLGWAERKKDELLGPKDIQVGIPELDRLYSIAGQDPHHVRRLLWGRPAETLLSMVATQPQLTVNDQYVVIEYPEYERGLEKCRWSLHAVARLAGVIAEARRREAAAWEPAWAATWSAVARGWGLELDAPRGRIEGAVRGTSVIAQLSPDGTHTELTITLGRRLGCTLKLEKQNGSGFFAKLFRGQDIIVGDAAFDEAFIVKGQPESDVRTLLNPDACRALVAALASYEGLEMEDDTLRVAVAHRIDHPEELDRLMKVCFAAATALFPAVRAESPFRT